MQKKLTLTQVLKKMCWYCAYRERSLKEAQDKLLRHKLSSDQNEEIIMRLIAEGYLNNQRFARAFARGKFRIKKWGKVKIIHKLNAHKLNASDIKQGLAEIEEEEYEATLAEVIKKKGEGIAKVASPNRCSKIALHAVQQGYEPDLVWRMIRDLPCNDKEKL